MKLYASPVETLQGLSAVAASIEKRQMKAVALRYAVAPACVLLAILLYLTPIGPALSLAGLCVLAVLVSAQANAAPLGRA